MVHLAEFGAIMAAVLDSSNYEIPYEWRVLFLGQTRSGKTYACRRLIDRHYGKVPILLYQTKPADPILDKMKVPRFRTLKQVIRHSKEPFVIFKPSPLEAEEPSTSEEMFRWLLTQRDRILWVNEVAAVTRETPRPPRAFAAYVKQGQGLGLGLWMEAQEPAYLPRILFSEASAIWKGYISNDVSAKAIRQKAPSVLSEPIAAGDRHGFHMWDSRVRGKAFYFSSIR
jgi:hypothetical protein